MKLLPLAGLGLVACSSYARVSGTNVVLKPAHTQGPSAAFIFIEGAEIEGSLYTPLLQQVQNKSGLSLWVGIPAFLDNTPEPVRLKADIEATIKDMEKQGFDPSAPGTLFFYGGHSLGTVFIQDYVMSDKTANAAGQVLTGGFLARKHFSAGPNATFSYPVPTLTIGGSLDGLARVSRTGAESYYQQISVADEAENFPVAIVEGMTHQQFASGPATGLVKQKDLKPEISDSEAHDAASTVIADFIDRLAKLPSAGSAVDHAVKATGDFLQPLIDAYLLEGSKHFNAPAQIGGSQASQCQQGGCPSSCLWAPVAQSIIAGVDSSGGGGAYVTNISNQYVDCKSSPVSGEVFHLPNISNTTKTASGQTVLEMTTFSQGKWETLDAADTGYTYTSASELGTKMLSRQCTMIKGEGLWQTNFSVDMQDFCAEANAQAFEWALAHADEATRTRFLSKGQNYTFGPDKEEVGGPFFLDAPISFVDNGAAGVEVTSPMMRTPIDYWNKTFPIPRPKDVPDPGCFHYCKLLSPARAMEWVYTDGLRLNACVTC